jgi:DNA polymerase III epsilon subunit-like protein
MEKKCAIIGLDFETTGLTISADTTKGDQIVEIGANILFFTIVEQKLKQVSQLKGFRHYVTWTKEMDEKAQLVTGIDKSALEHALPFATVIALFSEWLNSNIPADMDRHLVAYNGKKFDVPMLVTELLRHKISVEEYAQQLHITYFCDPLYIAKKNIDTTLLPKRKFGEASYSMGDVYKALLQKDLENAHSALADVDGMLEMLQHPTLLEPFLISIEQKKANDQDIFVLTDLMASLSKSFQTPLKKGQKVTLPQNCVSILDMMDRPKKKRKKTKSLIKP